VEAQVEAQEEAESPLAEDADGSEEPAGQAGGAGAARRGLGRGLGAILPARMSVPLELVGLGASRPETPEPEATDREEGRSADLQPRASLSSRGELESGLDQAMADARAEGSMVAVIVLGVNGFRHVNTAFGREAGDAMLQAVGERLLRSRRQGDLVARLQGDEFAVVCPRVDNGLGARRAVERVIEEFDTPIETAGVRHRLQATYGLSLDLAGEADSDACVLLRRAEMAMHRAKDAGLRWAVFTPQRDGHQRPRWNTSADDRRGLDDELDRGSCPPASPMRTAPK
jgi:diguanylate cyclase (GGDEF)-like protein